jgi:hypothetical protein
MLVCVPGLRPSLCKGGGVGRCVLLLVSTSLEAPRPHSTAVECVPIARLKHDLEVMRYRFCAKVDD